jgi:2'-5' RNA ligase
MAQEEQIPALDELAPYRYDKECYEVARSLAQQWPHLKEDAGFYVHPTRGPGDHGWNIASDGTIVDMTAAQHDYNGPEDEPEDDFEGEWPAPQHPEIISPDHPNYARYVSWTRHPEQSQVISHDRGEHVPGSSGYVDICPKCISSQGNGEGNQQQIDRPNDEIENQDDVQSRHTASKDELHVALSLPDEVADELHEWVEGQNWPEGFEPTPKDEYHITLLYVPEGHEEHRDDDWIREADGYWVETVGLDQFGDDAVVLRVDSPEVEQHADDLQDMAENRDLPLSRFPGGYKPHITLGYGSLPKYLHAPKLKFKSGPSTISTPRTSAAGHNLWHKRGDWGRGLVTPDGTIYTWPEEEMDHQQRWRALGLEEDNTKNFLVTPKSHISPNHDDTGELAQYVQEQTGMPPATDLDHYGSVWTQEYTDTLTVLTSILRDPAPDFPRESQTVGNSTAYWWEPNPGHAVIMAFGGSIDDRAFAEQYVKLQLEAYGYERTSFTVDGTEQKTAGWNEIMEKAKRLIMSGNVTMLRNGYNVIAGHVVGDHGEYNVEIGRDDPSSRAITTWTCECPWDQYAWQRTRQWKKYEGRPCSHVMALYWTSLSTPLDEDISPNQPQQPPLPGMPPGGHGAPAPSGQPQLAPNAPTPPGSPMPPSPMQQQGDQIIGQPTPAQAPLSQPPGSPDVLPPSPMEQLQMLQPPVPGTTPGGMPAPPGAVSVPGAKMPSPFNPIQYPGGTYSKIAAEEFQNGDIVRAATELFGVKEGRDGATDAGEYTAIPPGRRGEVLGQDPTTGFVDVIFPLDAGPMTSYHVRCFVEANEIVKVDGKTPFIGQR